MSLSLATRLRPFLAPRPGAAEGRAYDAVDARYVAYADGNTEQPFAFSGRYGFADRRIWDGIDATLCRLAGSGRRELSVLDVGCGPGTWIRRVALRAEELGFSRLDIRGFDVSQALIGRAAAIAAELTRRWPRGRGCITVEHGDAAQPLVEANGAVDLTLCLYGVLNHLPPASLPGVAAELARVTAPDGRVMLTVRTVGSPPTIYVDGIEKARAFRQDHATDRMAVDLLDGSHLEFRSHLFRAGELREVFAPHLDELSLRGLDLLLCRFTTDPRWNPGTLADDADFLLRLEALERSCADDPVFLDRAAHILLEGRPQRH